LSRADMFAMGAFIAASSPNYTTPYYGPLTNTSTPIALPLYIGRLDAESANPTGRLPGANESAAAALTRFATEYGFTSQETAAVVVGSHSIGGVNIKGQNTAPPVGTTYPTFFLGSVDGPAAIVDRRAFVKAAAGSALIPADNGFGVVDETKAWISEYSHNATSMYATYYASLLKMSLLGQNVNNLRIWTPPVPL
ncbi:hypothetical protein HDU93_000984, partial [Gonapodya sp. JEL0774]